MLSIPQCLIWLTIALSAIPPLTDDQISRLAGAVDGGDQHDEAFLALVENARQWTGELGDSPIRLHPDYSAMMQKPAEYRGELCRVTAVLQQSTVLSPPFQDVAEWFVREDSNHAVVVYVVGTDGPQPFKEFDRVEVEGRFYKRMAFVARDGKVRDYAAFVGAKPRLASAADTQPSISKGSIVAGLVSLLAIVFIGLMMWARKSGGGRREALRVLAHRTISVSNSLAVDEREPLPDDPSEALAELKRRAD